MPPRSSADQLDQQRERVGERQVEVDDVALVRGSTPRSHIVTHRPVVAVREHAALRRPGGAGRVDERVRVLGLDRSGARGDLGVVAAAAALAQVVHGDRVGRVAFDHDDRLEVREPVADLGDLRRPARRPRRTGTATRSCRPPTRTPPASSSGRSGRRRRRRWRCRSSRTSTRGACCRARPTRSPGSRPRSISPRAISETIVAELAVGDLEPVVVALVA